MTPELQKKIDDVKERLSGTGIPLWSMSSIEIMLGVTFTEDEQRQMREEEDKEFLAHVSRLGTEPQTPVPSTTVVKMAVASDRHEFANILRHLATRFEEDEELVGVTVGWDGQEVGIAERKAKKKG